MAKERIDKIFSNLGIMSRSDVKKAVKRGEITVNGVVCHASDEKADPDRDVLTYLDEVIDSKKYVFYMLNKPAGVITADEPSRCGTVFDFIEDGRTDLSAVGRLDKDTTGILFLTNHGELNHRLLSPRYHVEKTYRTTIDGVLTDEDVRRLENGIDIGDDKPTLPAKLKRFEKTSPETVELTITEGRYHQVKRMFEAVGKPVLSLHRVTFGPLTLDPDLAPGEYRTLTGEEETALFTCCSLTADICSGR